MDELCKQLEEAIIYANNSQTGPEVVQRRNEAISFINDLRSDQNCWKIAVETFFRTNNVIIIAFRFLIDL